MYGLKNKNLIEDEEYNLFTYEKFIKKEEKINKTLDELKKRFGENAITKGIKKP